MSVAPQPVSNVPPRQRYLRPGALLPPPAPRHRWGPLFTSLSIGISFFLLGALFDIILQRRGIGAPAIWWGDVLAGVIAGLLVLSYEQRRRREVIRHLETIRLMNHYVRNSLQVISYASSRDDHAQQVQNVREAIDRIDWALREVLPGHNHRSHQVPRA